MQKQNAGLIFKDCSVLPEMHQYYFCESKEKLITEFAACHYFNTQGNNRGSLLYNGIYCFTQIPTPAKSVAWRRYGG